MQGFTLALLIAVAVYWVFCLLVGVWASRNSTTPQEYFVAGRTLGPLVLGLSILATAQSAWMMVGNQGMVMKEGFSYVLAYAHVLSGPLLALFFLPQLCVLGKKMGFLTPGDLYGSYYGELTRVLMTVLAILYVVPYAATQFVGGGVIFEVLTQGTINSTLGALLLAIVVTLYVFLGGLRATAITDTVQGTLLVLGMFVLAGVVLANLQGGWGEFLQHVNTEFPREWRTLPGTSGAWPWQYVMTYSLVSLGIFASPVYHMWAFSARSPRIFRWQFIYIWGVLVGFYYFILSPIIGGGGRALLGVLEKPDALTPTILFELAPAWLAIIAAVGIFAAMNSTGDAYVAGLSSIVSHDLYRQYFKREATPREEVWVARILVVIIVAAGLLFSYITSDVIALIGGLATAFGLQTIPALAGILYWKRLTPQGINAGLIVGMIVVFLTYAVWKYPFGIHCGAWGLGLNFIVAYIVSLVTKPVDGKIQKDFYDLLHKARQSVQKVAT